MKNFNSNIDYYSLTITTLYTLIINFVIKTHKQIFILYLQISNVSLLKKIEF